MCCFRVYGGELFNRIVDLKKFTEGRRALVHVLAVFTFYFAILILLVPNITTVCVTSQRVDDVFDVVRRLYQTTADTPAVVCCCSSCAIHYEANDERSDVFTRPSTYSTVQYMVHDQLVTRRRRVCVCIAGDRPSRFETRKRAICEENVGRAQNYRFR